MQILTYLNCFIEPGCKCIQSAAAALSFAVASKINLLWNVIILVALAVSTVITYISLHRISKSKSLEESESEAK